MSQLNRWNIILPDGNILYLNSKMKYNADFKNMFNIKVFDGTKKLDISKSSEDVQKSVKEEVYHTDELVVEYVLVDKFNKNASIVKSEDTYEIRPITKNCLHGQMAILSNCSFANKKDGCKGCTNPYMNIVFDTIKLLNR